MSFQTAALPNGIRIHYHTEDPKELTAHLETLDALQIRRPREFQTPRCMWAADVWLSDDGEYSPLRVWAAPEDIEYEIARLEQMHADYFHCEARITGLSRDAG